MGEGGATMATMNAALIRGKRAVREALLKRRAAQPFWLRRVKSWRMARRAQRLSAIRRARLIFAYFPVRGEVDTRSLITCCLQRGQAVALPRVAGRKLVFHRIRSLATLSPGAYGIPEPPASSGGEVAMEQADAILVPGVAFSLLGLRLGYGSGYYDALLRSRRGAALGLAFEFQLLPDLPQSSKDVPLDALVTERRLLLFGR